MTLSSGGLVRSCDKLKMSYLHFNNACDHQALQHDQVSGRPEKT